MAIIQRESDFDWLAAPEWDKLFKVIPYKRKSSAFGYSQAINKTWDQFVRETDQPLALRISFNDSVDFIGWYINKSNQILKIPKDDYFKQYIAYHEGWGNFKDYCGTCTRCIDACPTQAIVQPYVVDGSKCISYLTIELKENIPSSFQSQMDDWMFGCDVCQDVCPWNKFSKPHHEPLFLSQNSILEWDRKQWEEITEETFKKVFSKSAVKRTKYNGLKRNIQFLKPKHG